MQESSKPRQVRRTRRQWAELLAEQIDSGLSQRAFCESRGLSLATFYNAKRRAGKVGSDIERMAGSDFVTVPLELSRTEANWDVELTLGDGVVLRLRST